MKNKGFTLVEVLIAIAIIAAIASVFVSSLSTVRSTENRKAANQVVSMMAEAKVLSASGEYDATLKRYPYVEISFDQTKQEYVSALYLEGTTWSNNFIPGGTGILVEEEFLAPKGTKITYTQNIFGTNTPKVITISETETSIYSEQSAVRISFNPNTGAISTPNELSQITIGEPPHIIEIVPSTGYFEYE